MAAVLGIDAAWTAKNNSGVALVTGEGDNWKVVRVAASYADFLQGLGATDTSTKELIRASERLCGEELKVIAVDMPLSKAPITCRRVSDNAISLEFGGRWCSTHTPSAQRPGQIADRLREDCAELGFLLATTAGEPHVLIEVYPHPALVNLLSLDRRLPYKAANARKYWPEAGTSQRRENLAASFRAIYSLAESRFGPLAFDRPDPLAPLRELKACEDTLDALVCAITGVEYLSNRCKAFGDHSSAIWVPN